MQPAQSTESTRAVCEALCMHASQVRHYYESTLAQIQGLEGEDRTEMAMEFLADGGELIEQLEKSVRLSLQFQRQGLLNVEQLEAEVEYLQELFKHVRQSLPCMN